MINVAYCGNSKIFKGIYMSALSLVDKCDAPVTFYIFTMDYTELKPVYTPITEEQRAFFEETVKEFNPENRVLRFDVTELHKKEFYGKNKDNEYTPYALIRLIFDLIDDIPDKMLYLDIDTMLMDDVRKLYDIDISEYEFACVLDYMGKFWIAGDYFNTGVMLLNMKMIKETGLYNKSRELVNVKWFKMVDQSAVYRNKTKALYIDGRFNEQRDIKPDTVVKHFNKGIKWLPFFHIYNVKQWEIDKVHKVFSVYAFDAYYDRYIEDAKLHPELFE